MLYIRGLDRKQCVNMDGVGEGEVGGRRGEDGGGWGGMGVC